MVALLRKINEAEAMMMTKQKMLPISAGLMVSVIFGLSFMFTRDALDAMPPMQLLGFRFALAALLLTLLKITGVVKVALKGKNITGLLIVALFQPVLYFLCETTGVQLTSASEAGMMMGLIPVIVVLLEVPFFKTVPGVGQLGSILISVAGIFFIAFMKGSIEIGYSYVGTVALLGAVVSAGMYNILSKKSSQDFTPMEITYIMMWIGALFFNSILVINHFRAGTLGYIFVPLAQQRTLFAVVYLGALSSVAAFFLVNFMLSKLRASQSATFANLTTVVAILAGVIFRGETFAWFQAVGAAMIVFGVWGTTYFAQEKPVGRTVLRRAAYSRK